MLRDSLPQRYRPAGRVTAIFLVSALLTSPVVPQTKLAQRPLNEKNIAPYIPFFRAFNPRLKEFELGDKKRISDSWSAVVIRATSSRATMSEVQQDIRQLLMQEAFGIDMSIT